MPIRYYTDTHIPKAVAIQLRQKGVDIVRCEELDLQEAKDETHLEHAAKEQRTLVSRDTDFLRIHREWLEQGRKHYGILFLQDHLQGESSMGVIVRTLMDYYDLVEGGAATVETDFVNQVYFIR
jgi:predicted nuclease of predicted toxin-antitoxin system